MTFPKILKSFVTLGLLTILLLTSGCAHNPAANPQDPYEGYNRKVFKFNMGVDKVVYRPIAKAYDFVTPKVAQHGVSNFFRNIDQVPTIANDILQFNLRWAAADTGRLLINTTLGIGGLFDVAKGFGLEKHTQDFGLTLAKWGYRKSSYLVLPFLPSGTVRDLVGQGVDITALSIWPYVRPHWITYAAYGLDFTNRRAALIGPDKLIYEAFDPYIFVRDAYLQQRNAQIQQILHPKSKPEDLGNDVFSEPDEPIDDQAQDSSKTATTTASEPNQTAAKQAAPSF